jgi:SAM-dependent methyltransferase
MNMLDELLRHPILSARSVVRRIREIPSKGLPRLRRAQKDDFDRKHGVETSRLVWIVPTDSPNCSHGNKYEAAPETIIRWCIENCGMGLSETTFVDLGSGKGRALIVATFYPFERIIGVEYSPQLAAICRQNLEKLGIADKCQVITGDAAEYQFPDGNLLVFLYNPFDTTILEQVIKNLANTKGQTKIAQLGPGHDAIKKSGLARVICSGEGPTLYEILNSGRNATRNTEPCQF